MDIDSDINDNKLNTIPLHGLFVLGMHMLFFGRTCIHIHMVFKALYFVSKSVRHFQVCICSENHFRFTRNRSSLRQN